MHMVIESARLAASELFKPKFRSVLLKSVGLTILMFIAMWIVLEALFSTFLAPVLGPWPWVSTAIIWLMSAGLLVGAGFLLAPVTALIAGIFLDDVAEYVEREHYAADGPGTAMPIFPSIIYAVRFFLVVVAANLAALALVPFIGFGFAIFSVVNGYLLGREYFMFAAMRFRPEDEANHMRKARSTDILLAGMIIAAFMAVPILNLATPVFAAAMMVHIHKMLSGRQPVRTVSQHHA